MALGNARTLYELLSLRAELAAHALAVVDGPLRLSNAELFARVRSVARSLMASGVRHGDRVATLAPPSADFWITYLGATAIGAIWQGLNPKYQRNEYAHLLSDAQPRVVFVRSPLDDRDYLEELQALAVEGTAFVRLGEQALTCDNPFTAQGTEVSDVQLGARTSAVQEQDTAVIVYTSGTTGQPKGAMLSHRAVVQTALAHVQWIGKGLGSTICAAPINHVGCLNNVCMPVFAAGGHLIFVPRVDFALLGAVTQQERPSYLVASPTAFAMMLAIPGFSFAAYKGTYETIVFGGASTPLAHLIELQKAETRFSSVYGQTETTGMVTYTEFGAPLDMVSETIGQPIAGMALRLAQADDRVCAIGEVGEIQVKGIAVMTGYFNRPEATAEAFTAEGWLRTGDLGLQRPDGSVSFAGRLKEMFKSGGYNIYPVEIELAICEHPDVAQAAVVGLPHDVFQEVGHAFVQPKPGRSVDTEQLRGFLKARIANYKVPKTWTVMQALTVLPNGKLDKRGMRDELLRPAN